MYADCQQASNSTSIPLTLEVFETNRNMSAIDFSPTDIPGFPLLSVRTILGSDDSSSQAARFLGLRAFCVDNDWHAGVLVLVGGE
jgi:hypothetical protein